MNPVLFDESSSSLGLLTIGVLVADGLLLPGLVGVAEGLLLEFGVLVADGLLLPGLVGVAEGLLLEFLVGVEELVEGLLGEELNCTPAFPLNGCDDVISFKSTYKKID